jgi:hypothetical protein
LVQKFRKEHKSSEQKSNNKEKSLANPNLKR